MSPVCVNEGGPASRIRVDDRLQLEQEAAVGASGCEALRRWQARCGEILTVTDADQRCYRARLICWRQDEARLVPFELLAEPESPVDIWVYQALPEKERFEWILQKLTEIGVQRVVPFVSARSTTLEQRDAPQPKSHRWPEVVRRAARQCRRAQLPQLTAVVDWPTLLADLALADVKLLLAEKGPRWSLAEGLGRQRPQQVAVIVGPEGGFTDEEIAAAQAAGAVPLMLGPRLLRTETAALVAAALVQGRVGDYV